MNKLIKSVVNLVLIALAITSIVFLSLLIASKFETINNLQAINLLGFQDEKIAIEMRDVWGLFIANVTLFLYIVTTTISTIWTHTSKK